ncbi:TPA: YgjV family protein [Vibrio vulnificus]|nr:YgjV family protein [Vibrio vulnificus]
MNESLVQALGFVALCLNLFASSTTNDNRMRAIICLSCLTFSIHYALLGAVVAGLNLLVNSFRALVSVKYKGLEVFYLFLAVQIAMSVYFYSEPRDVLPAIASIISCYALFIAEGMRMRIAFLICTLIWMTNAVLVGSYGGLLNDMFNATMLSITIFRIKNNKKIQMQTN